MTNILVLMAGEGTRFSQISVPKPFIQFKGIPLFHRATESFSRRSVANKFIFVVQEKHINHFNLEYFLSQNYTNYEIVLQEGKRNGATFSALEAADLIDSDDELFIVDCDQYNEFDPLSFSKLTSEKFADGAILSFYSNDPANSFIDFDDNNIITDIVEKDPSYSHCSAGVYYWSAGKKFVKYAKIVTSRSSPDVECYISNVYKYAISTSKRKILRIQSNKTVSIGDYNKYCEFLNIYYYNGWAVGLDTIKKWGTEYKCKDIDIINVQGYDMFSIKDFSIMSKQNDDYDKKFYGKTYIFVYDSAFFHIFYDKINQYELLKKIIPDINIVFITSDNLSMNSLFNSECDHNHDKSIPRKCETEEIGDYTDSAEVYIQSINNMNKSMYFMSEVQKEYDPDMKIYGIPNHNMWFEEIIFIHDREEFISPFMFAEHYPIEMKEHFTSGYHKIAFTLYHALKDTWDKYTKNNNKRKKIFLSREHNNKMLSSVQNTTRNTSAHEAVIGPILKEMGFEQYDFEGMKFSEQLQIIKDSDIIVAMAGSALHNTFFAKPGSLVVEIHNVHNFGTPYRDLLRKFPEINYTSINMRNDDPHSNEYLIKIKNELNRCFTEFN